MGKAGCWKEVAARAMADYRIFNVSSSDRESEDASEALSISSIRSTGPA